jgi:hypothetical protein
VALVDDQSISRDMTHLGSTGLLVTHDLAAGDGTKGIELGSEPFIIPLVW